VAIQRNFQIDVIAPSDEYKQTFEGACEGEMGIFRRELDQ
jgi:hypothetical protein